MNNKIYTVKKFGWKEVLEPIKSDVKGMSLTSKKVLAQAILYSGMKGKLEKGMFFRSNSDFANDCGIDTASLRWSIGVLDRKGYLKKVQNGDRLNGASIYQLRLDLVGLNPLIEESSSPIYNNTYSINHKAYSIPHNTEPHNTQNILHNAQSIEHSTQSIEHNTDSIQNSTVGVSISKEKENKATKASMQSNTYTIEDLNKYCNIKVKELSRRHYDEEDLNRLYDELSNFINKFNLEGADALLERVNIDIGELRFNMLLGSSTEEDADDSMLAKVF